MAILIIKTMETQKLKRKKNKIFNNNSNNKSIPLSHDKNPFDYVIYLAWPFYRSWPDVTIGQIGIFHQDCVLHGINQNLTEKKIDQSQASQSTSQSMGWSCQIKTDSIRLNSIRYCTHFMIMHASQLRMFVPLSGVSVYWNIVDWIRAQSTILPAAYTRLVRALTKEQ